MTLPAYEVPIVHALAVRAQPPSSRPVVDACQLHPVTLPLEGRPIARVVQTLVNAAIVQSGQTAPPIEAAACEALASSGRFNLRHHQGVPLRLHLNQDQLFVAGYNALYGPARAQALLAALDDYDSPGILGPPPRLMPHLRAPQPPRLMRQPSPVPQAPAPLLVPRPPVHLDDKHALTMRLGDLGGSAWSYSVLYPALARAGGQTLRFDRFISHYLLSMALALDDEGAPEPPWHSATVDQLLCHALLPDAHTCRAVLAWLTLLDLDAITPRPRVEEAASLGNMAG